MDLIILESVKYSDLYNCIYGSSRSPSPLNSYEQEKTTDLILTSLCTFSIIEPPTKLHFV